MSRIDCISNLNIKIIASYVTSKLGHYDTLFDGILYPGVRYASPEEFFLNEDEWTTYESAHLIFRKAKELVGEPYFYFNCGASSAHLKSWGRFDYFTRVFSNPREGFKRVPFFNKTLNDTKDIEVVMPPTFSKAVGKIRTILKVRYHDDMDVNKDYITDPYRRGLISSIPTIWGLRPAMIKQPLNPYNPEILFREEPEFSHFALEPRLDNRSLTIKHPLDRERKEVGKRVVLEPEIIDGKEIFLGKYREFSESRDPKKNGRQSGILITETVQVNNRVLLKAGEIFDAPYFIMDITYDKFSLPDRVSQMFKLRKNHSEDGKGLIDTINRLRETMEIKNRAFQELEKANAALIEAKNRVDDYAVNLEKMVEERTAELKRAKVELVRLNRSLEDKVKKQVDELERYNELRRYLSPKLAEKILSSGDALGAEPQRKMMTVVFSDIRNFSSVTDSIEPEEIFHLLDRYLSEMTKIIHRHEGTLNKIIGDGLLIFFGDPIPMEDHARRAVSMAIDMQKKAAELREEWAQFGYELGIGIGINTGYMSVGNIGSEIHKDYTVIGNQVNVAARLESLAGAGQILIGQRTYSRVKDMVDAEKVGEILVKGIHMPVVTYLVKVY